MTQSKQGYILPLTIMIIAMSVVMVTSIIQRSLAYQRQARIMAEREQARALALSGLELVLSKISLVLPPEKETKEKKEAEKKEGEKEKKDEEAKKKAGDEKLLPVQQWLLQFLPVLNKWQTVELTEKGEGIEGSISFYISSEQGKINLTYLDKLTQQGPTGTEQKEAKEQEEKKQQEEKKKAEAEKKTPLNALDELIKKAAGVSVKAMLKEARDRLKRPVEDATELVSAKSFAPLKDRLFVEQQPAQKGRPELYAMDLFTSVQGSGTLNPWLLSQSTKTILGLRENKEVKINTQFVKNVKPTMNWATDWDKVLAPLYGKKFNSISQELRPLLAPNFEATAFSAVVYARVGTVTQRISALLENIEPPASLSSKSMLFKVTRLYWL
jgi:hypothetical protein